MRRTILLLAGVLLCVVALGSDSPKEYDDKTETLAIEGTWRLTENDFGGKKGKPDIQQVLTFRNGTVTSNFSDGGKYIGTYHVNRTHNPAHLDCIIPEGGLTGPTHKFIYRVTGDTLRLARKADISDGRPAQFQGEDVLIGCYNRVK